MKKYAFLSMNFAVLLFGLAGLFARWVHLPALNITFGRALFSFLALGVYLFGRGQSFRLSETRDLLFLISEDWAAIHFWNVTTDDDGNKDAYNHMQFIHFVESDEGLKVDMLWAK